MDGACTDHDVGVSGHRTYLLDGAKAPSSVVISYVYSALIIALVGTRGKRRMLKMAERSEAGTKGRSLGTDL